MVKRFLSILTVLIPVLAAAQGNSPYSQLGIGDIVSSPFQSNFTLGGATSAIRNSNLLNPGNPASYSSIRYTMSEVGVFTSQNYYSQGASSGSDNRTEMGGVGFGFPLTNNWGLSFGLSQYSALGYNFSEEGEYSTLSRAKFTYEGEGGINKLYLGTGYNFKGLSLGVNGEYLFGRINRSTKIQFYDAGFENTRFRHYNYISGFSLKSGLQYERKLNEKFGLILGGTFGLNNSLTTKNYVNSNVFTIFDGGENHNYPLTVDTEETPTEGKLVLPLAYTAGLRLVKNESWSWTVDYQFTDWSQFSINNVNEGFRQAQQFILGWETTPNTSALGTENYWKSVNYRLGLKYGTTPYVYNGTQIQEYGINFGFMLPLRKMKYNSEKFGSYVIASFEYSKRGFGSSNLILEDFFKVNASIVLNDKWFIKRKFK